MSAAAARYIELDTDPGPNDTTGAAASRPRWDAALELNLSYQVLILDFFPARAPPASPPPSPGSSPLTVSGLLQRVCSVGTSFFLFIFLLFLPGPLIP